MAFVALQTLNTSTTSFTTIGATAINLPSSVIAFIIANLPGGDFTTVSVSDGVNQEFMNITGVTSGAANVTRAQAGSTAVGLAKGASVRFVWTEQAILAVAPGGTVTCAGSGGTNVTGGPNYTISSPIWTFSAGAGIGLAGGPYHFTISSTVPAGPPGPTGPTGPAVVVTASGIAVASGGPITYNIAVPATSLTAGTGISVTGTFPNFTIANTQVQGGTGTVTSLVAGNRISITGGTPTINPTVNLTTVGPGAGVYGGLTLDAYGCITAVASTLITSISTSTTGMTVGNPSLGVITVNTGSASHSTQGLVALAPATSGGSNDSGNDAQAVTPKGINAVVAALVITPATLTQYGTQNALSSGSYTNTISGFNIAVTVLTGKFALIDLFVETYDPSNLTVVQSIGIGLFNGGALLAGNQNIIGSSRNLKYLVTGPLTATLTVKTTTLVGTQVVASYNASVINN